MMIWAEIDRYVKEHHMLEKTGTVVIGLSGGSDSVCLARYFLYLRKKGGPQLIAVHVNHMLRSEEADRDQEFVRSFCRRWDIPLHIFKKDVRALSDRDKQTLEEAGRIVRYACFHQVVNQYLAGRKRENELVRIAVAHHADDLAETMLFRMIRGTGPNGLVGMRPVQENVIRPLLGIRKKRVLQILETLGQEFVEDGSNVETDYSRNYIRHQILGELLKINPKAVEHLCSLSRQESELLEYTRPGLEKLFRKLIRKSGDQYEVSVCELLNLADYPRRETAKRLLFLASGVEKDIGAVHVEQLLKLAQGPDGKRNDFPYDVIAVRRKDRLILLRKNKNPALHKEDICRELTLPAYEEGKLWSVDVRENDTLDMRYEAYHGQEIPKKDCEKYFDYDTINHKLLLRTRRKGDFFILDDQGKHKRLSRYFIDNKVPGEKRDRQLLLAEDRHILWIIGGRISASCRITTATGRMLVVTYRQKNDQRGENNG